MEEKLQILLKEKFNKNLDNCSKEEIFEALLLLTKEANGKLPRNEGEKKLYYISAEIIYVFLTIFLYLLKCPQSLILSALRAFCFCGKSHIPRSIFLYFRYQSWLKSW